MNDIERAIKQFEEWEKDKWRLGKSPSIPMLMLAKKALEKQQEFNEYMEYMKQLPEDETKPLADRQFAEKFAICFEDFV